MKPIAILGAGNMASALALHLTRNQQPIRLYSIEPDVTEDINVRRQNSKYLPGHTLPATINASHDLASVVKDAEVVFLAIPSSALANVMSQLHGHLKRQTIIVSFTKGLDPACHEPLCLVEQRRFPKDLQSHLCIIGGPAMATEMAKGSPTGLVVASHHAADADKIKRLLQAPNILVEISTDVRGVGLCSALKNPYGIALGICDGLRLPHNTKALVTTLAIREMARLLKACHAKADTASGLAGLGDVIVTGFSSHGRNRRYGEALVTAKQKNPAALGLTTVEGIAATRLAIELAAKCRLHLPLLNAVGRCLGARRNFAAPFQSFLSHLDRFDQRH